VSSAARAPGPAPSRPSAPRSAPSTDERIHMHGIPRISERWFARYTAAHFTYVEEIDVTDWWMRGRPGARRGARGQLPSCRSSSRRWCRSQEVAELNAPSTRPLRDRPQEYWESASPPGPAGAGGLGVRDADKRSIRPRAGDPSAGVRSRTAPPART
jgi:hypothetical protein